MLNFQKMMFKFDGDLVFDSGKLSAFVFSFNDMATRCKALAGVGSTADGIITARVAALVTCISTPTYTEEPSRVEAIGHTWQNAFGGVSFFKHPPMTPSGDPRESIRQTNGGVVVATGATEQGFGLFAGDVQIHPIFGLQGSGFLAPVQNEAVKAAIVFGGF